MQQYQRTENGALQARKDFESKVFLLFALRFLYRSYVRPPMIKNWIAKLQREVKEARKGNRKRGRGPLIRFGKKVIEALLKQKPDLASELHKDYTGDANCSLNFRAQLYGSSQYDYTLNRAKRALEKALWAFRRNKPTERLPIMRDQYDFDSQTPSEEASSAYSLIEKRKQAAQKRKITQQDKKFWEEEQRVAQLLRNECNDDFDEDDTIPHADMDGSSLAAGNTALTDAKQAVSPLDMRPIFEERILHDPEKAEKMTFTEQTGKEPVTVSGSDNTVTSSPLPQKATELLLPGFSAYFVASHESEQTSHFEQRAYAAGRPERE